MDIDTGTVAELPDYHALLVVDMKNFSGERGRDHARLTEAIPEILHHTFRRCGLAELWSRAQFEGTTGDGYFLGFEGTFLPFLVNPFLPALQEELAYQNSVSRQTIRMRAAVNVGPMTGSAANTISEGSGNARVENHRLLDSEPVRDLLDRSGSVTCVAAIVSARAFEDAVLSGYSGADPDLFVPVPVQVKSYEATAYLHVPRPSGDLLGRGFTTGSDREPAEHDIETPAPSPGNITTGAHSAVAKGSGRASIGVGDVSGNNNQVTSVQGDQHSGPRYEGSQHHSTHQNGDRNIHVSGDSHGGIHQNHGAAGNR